MSRTTFLLSGRLAAGVASLAALALALSSCGISLQQLPKPGAVTGPTYTVTASFANVVNLPEDAQVQVGAFTVGTVTDITTKNFVALVKMKIRKSVKLPTGTTAQIGFQTPLGVDFVQLTPPTPNAGPYLTSGSFIPESNTTTAPSVEDALAALGAILNGGGINQLETVIQQTNLALDGNQPQVRSLLNSLSATLTSFAQNTPALDTALTAIAQLSQVLNQGKTTITNGIAALGPAVGVLASENGNFDSLLKGLDQLSSAANSIITASSAGTVETVRALLPLLNQLVSVQQQIGPTLTALDALEVNTPKATPGDYVNLAINAQIQTPQVPTCQSGQTTNCAPPLQKETVDPPEAAESASQSATVASIAIILEGGLP